MPEKKSFKPLPTEIQRFLISTAGTRVRQWILRKNPLPEKAGAKVFTQKSRFPQTGSGFKIIFI
ncbi:MAG: hypothetical protein IJF04_06710, partial [Oscillospiraceae bacterium]|nr:hypothetical protein [Oscillospiraceae bacterium]